MNPMISDPDRYAERLRTVLDGLLDNPVVSAERTNLGRVLISVVSPTFEGKEQFERQRFIWGAVLDNFDEGDQRRIEFIYTDAPSELASPVQSET